MANRFDEILAGMQTDAAKPKQHHREREHRLQCACVRWFAYQYPQYRGRLFAVPNGSKRDHVTAAKLKAEGVVPGVSDLIFLKQNARYGALLIEMKTPDGRQSETQKQWQSEVTAGNEFKYVVCRSVDDFMNEINSYLR